MDNRALLLMKLCAAIKAGSSGAEKTLEVLRRKSNRPVSVLSKPNKKGETKPLQGAILERRLEEATNDVPDEGIEELLDIIEGKGAAFTPEAGCGSELSCRETGECLGLCRVVKDEATHTEADTLAMAALKGAETIGEVLTEEVLGDHNPETPIVVQRETTAPLPVVTLTEPAPEVIMVRYEDRDYQIFVRENGNVDFVSPQGSKVVHSGFIVDWQRGLRQPTVGSQAIVEGGKVVALRLLQAYTWSLNKGKGRKNPNPITETITAPESAITPAAAPAKIEETIMVQQPIAPVQPIVETTVETYTFDMKEYEGLCHGFMEAAEKLCDSSVNIAMKEAWKKFEPHFAAVLANSPPVQVSIMAACMQSIIGCGKMSEEGEAGLRLVVGNMWPALARTSACALTWKSTWDQLGRYVQKEVLESVIRFTSNPEKWVNTLVARGIEDEEYDRLVNQEVKAREVLAEIDRRWPGFTGPSFTIEKVAARVAENANCPIEMATRIVAESRKSINPAPTEAPITEEAIVPESVPVVPVQPVIESTTTPTEAPKSEETAVSQPAPIAPVVPTVTEEAVKAALVDLKARYAAHPASDRKIKNARNEGVNSIEARIKKGEWDKAMVRLVEALKTVPAVPVTEPSAPKPVVVEMPKPTTVAGVTVVQGVFEKPQPIIPPVAEPAPKPVIDVKPVAESTPAPSATTPAAPEAATQKKEATVPQQPETVTPKADESATTPAAPEAVANEEKKMDKKDEKGPGMWAKLTAAVKRFDSKIHFRCGPTKAPEGMDKIVGIVAAATVGVQPGEFVSSTGTGVGIKIVRKAAEIVEEAINIAHMKTKLGYEIEADGQTLTFAQWRLAAEKQPELQAVVDQGSAAFEAQWSNKLPLFMPSIVEAALVEFYKGKEEGVARALIMSALVEAFHVRNPAKRVDGWKLDRTLVKSLIVDENVTDAQVESLAKAGEKILDGGGASEAKAMLRGLEAASIHGEDNAALIGSIPDVAMVGALITGAKMFMCCGNGSIVGLKETEALVDSNMMTEFDNLLTALANQKFAFPKDPSRLDCLAGFGSANLGEVGQDARLYCIVQSAESLVGSEGGPEFVRLMIAIRSAKKAEQIEKIKGGRGMVRKTSWAIYVAGKWIVLAVVAVVAWAFLPAKVVFYAGKAGAMKIASLFAGKDEVKKTERNAAAGEAWACCKTAAVDIVMRPVRFVKRTATSMYTKMKGWFTKSGDQQTNGTEQSANETEKKMNIFTGVLSQKFGEAKGAKFSKQSWYMKAASIAMSPFVASWRVAKTYTAEVVVAAASAGIAIIAGASALVVGGVAVAGAAVGFAARWIKNRFFGKKDAATTQAPAVDAAAQQVAA